MARHYIIDQTVLKNGLRVITNTISEAELTRCELIFDTGSWHDYKLADDRGPSTAVAQTHMNGLAHISEHLIPHAHPVIDDVTLREMMRAQSTGFNFSTGADYTRYYADGFKSSVFEYLDFVGTACASLAYRTGKFEIEQGRIIDEMATKLKSPDRIDSVLFQEAYFGIDQIGGRPTGGSPETLAAITLDDIRAYHRRTHTSDNATLIFTGDITHEEACARAQMHLSGLPRGTRYAKIVNTPLFNADFSREVFFRPNDVRVGVYFLVAGDWRTQNAMDVLSVMLKPVLKEHVEDKFGVYHYSLSGGRLFGEYGGLSLAFKTKPDNVRKTIEETVRQIIDVISRITPEGIEKAKAKILARDAVQSARGLIDLGTRADSLLYGHKHFNDVAYFTGKASRIRALTHDDIIAAARACISQCAQTIYIGKAGDYPTTLELNGFAPSDWKAAPTGPKAHYAIIDNRPS